MIPSRSSDISHLELAELIGPDARLILEVGANDGEDTVLLLDHNKNADVICWECDPRAIKAWRKRLAARHMRAKLHEHALDETAGLKKFYPSSGSPREDIADWSKSGSLLKPTGHLRLSPWCSFDNEIRVVSQTLDTCLMDTGYSHDIIDLLWIDVQGAELNVFKGGLDALRRTRFVKAECHPGMYEGDATESEMLTFMQAHGFECLGRYALDLVFAGKPCLAN